ncbi:RNA-binding protein 4 isoform X5 [Saccopteryx bilineata]|uniref:RNA-binding protein 4 isoform X5 n=1 Tax=Saccopteryx bilineata TaxID=59482 RepID=UPI00338FECD6
MVKLFIGNLPREATEQEIRSLFEQYGKVLECDIIKNYGFVHIEDKTAAEDAIRNLHHYKLHGVNINVEASKNKSKTSTKLHVGNISPTCTNKELRAKFEEYGPVIECDIVKDYAFVHMERAEDAVEAIRGLDNTEFQEERDGERNRDRERRGKEQQASTPIRALTGQAQGFEPATSVFQVDTLSTVPPQAVSGQGAIKA